MKLFRVPLQLGVLGDRPPRPAVKAGHVSAEQTARSNRVLYCRKRPSGCHSSVNEVAYGDDLCTPVLSDVRLH